ncbi:hypothetical protein GALMADRAFT_63506 [Galerina marginata CBS 339.88]|uniref:Copper transport protein n=1 Tax=Galerina marginata (strain CBS 339.88) TaxID=685588 RepID=A0A067TB32_GALM3|nr:hypothetical protein GALMADRAFT_63506 [Galerina marginata CBS 339.88]
MRLAFALSLLAPLSLVLAHGGGASNGMDMSMDGAMSLTGANMVPYLHFAPGDTLWFLGWAPLTKGAMAGTCIGLFLLALVDRWLAAIRATAENHWRARAQIVYTNKRNSTASSSSKGSGVASKAAFLRRLPPFIPAQDISRGILHAGQVALGFAFMLVIMTFQGAFIISIVLGLGIGEMMFGRFSGASGH